jgi:hypothetical protein
MHVEDVEFKFGEPDEINERQNGYVYTYNTEGRVWRSKRMVSQYIRLSFNNEDTVRSVQSTTTKRVKRFSGWKTFGLPATIFGGVVIFVSMASAASSP